MSLKIVTRFPSDLPVRQADKDLLQRLPINPCGIIKIYFGASSRRKPRTVAIEIIQRQPCRLTTQRLLKFFCQPAFARSTPPDDCHKDGATKHFAFLFTFHVLLFVGAQTNPAFFTHHGSRSPIPFE